MWKECALLRDSVHVTKKCLCSSSSLAFPCALLHCPENISGGNIKSHEAVKGGIKASINCLDYFLVHDITTLLDTTPWIIY